MSLPTITGTARLLEDPELRFSASGMAILKMRLVFNSRRKNPDTGAWEDSDSFFVNAVMFKQAAENAAEALARQTEVVVTGRLKTENWETKTGEKRSAPSLLIDSIGPAVNNFQTARVSKMDRSSSAGSQQTTATTAPADDPWSSEPPF
jgi:single-strand DNA-binding protein